ncbi:LysR family transcriptional regulator, partial [Streptomyces nigra]|uniref:LysR family transcriptional regulator n=1 Tax=Streptomyces nigra TaxID=1827580 RepID=UPI0034565818
MELRRLEHFLAVAEQRNFTQAARQIHLGQSTLSLSVKALERELGAELFVRTRNGVTLTDAGIALLPEARAGQAAPQVGREGAGALRRGVRGAVRLG